MTYWEREREKWPKLTSHLVKKTERKEEKAKKVSIKSMNKEETWCKGTPEKGGGC